MGNRWIQDFMKMTENTEKTVMLGRLNSTFQTPKFVCQNKYYAGQHRQQQLDYDDVLNSLILFFFISSITFSFMLFVWYVEHLFFSLGILKFLFFEIFFVFFVTAYTFILGWSSNNWRIFSPYKFLFNLYDNFGEDLKKLLMFGNTFLMNFSVIRWFWPIEALFFTIALAISHLHLFRILIFHELMQKT